MTHAERRVLAAIVVAFAAAYALVGLVRHWHFQSSAFDLGIYDQVVWHLSRFEAPASSIRGFSNMFGDHFDPVLALFAPLYWIMPTPETLIVAQAVLLATSAVPVYVYVRRRLPASATAGLTVAYALFWGIQQTAVFDVHDMSFAPLVIAAGILAMDGHRWGWFWTAMAGLVLVREDLIPVIAGCGAYLFLVGERRRGLVAFVVGTLLFLIVIKYVVPSMSEAGVYMYTAGTGRALRQPWLLPIRLVTPAAKLRTILLWFAPFLFLPLASPLSMLLVPLALERLLSPTPNHWGTIFHYSAPLAPILAMAAGDGLARIMARTAGVGRGRRAHSAIAGVCVLLAAVLPGHQPILRLFSPSSYRPIAAQQGANAALGYVPRNASVVAQAAIVPHLSERRDIFMLQKSAPDADVVVAAPALSPWPEADPSAIQALIDARRRGGYSVLFDRDGWIVLGRPTRH